ncbi:MAG: hypothetical protein ABIU05_07335 [Nitrospirales bacterium]
MSRPTYRVACLLTICIGILVLNACSTERIAMALDVLKELKPESQITIVHYDPEPFSIWRGERTGRGTALMLCGAIGGAIEGGMAAANAKEAGAKFISQSQMIDPITDLEARFLKTWQQEIGVKKLGLPQFTDDDEAGVLQTKYVTGYVLDFRTLGWTILPLPWSSFDPKTYRAAYGVRARLVRLVDKTVVWQGTCEYDKDSSLTPPLDLTHIDGIDKGIVVRNAFNTLAVHCADLLWRQFFGRDAGPDLPSPPTLEKQALR